MPERFRDERSATYMGGLGLPFPSGGTLSQPWFGGVEVQGTGKSSRYPNSGLVAVSWKHWHAASADWRGTARATRSTTR